MVVRPFHVLGGRRMIRNTIHRSAVSFASLVLLAVLLPSTSSLAQSQASRVEIARGKYLVGFGGCNDCHTPGYFFGKPDLAKALSGSEVGFEIPELGVFHGPNLTPDKETGLGNWTKAQIVTALQKGTRPDGRQLAPIMPWRALANLTKRDVEAIAAYLKSLPPIKNKVPGPFGPKEKPTSFVMKIVPPEK
jgi:mono/diheme cytochrome c family protein